MHLGTQGALEEREFPSCKCFKGASSFIIQRICMLGEQLDMTAYWKLQWEELFTY